LKQRAALAKAAEAQQQEKHSGGNLHNKNRIFIIYVHFQELMY